MAVSFCMERKSITIWYPRRESNPQLRFRRASLYPFNYGDVSSCIEVGAAKR